MMRITPNSSSKSRIEKNEIRSTNQPTDASNQRGEVL